MTDWQKGDLALCVSPEGYARKGSKYTVEFVFHDDGSGETDAGWGLAFCDLPPPYGHDGYGAWRFRKINPPEATEDDREVIELMTGKPERVPTAQFDRLLKAAAKELLDREWRATGKDGE